MATNSRKKTRRESERRSKERRINPYAFGTDEWRELIQQQYLLWPKEDRRNSERRSKSRRQTNRRGVNSSDKVRVPRKFNNLHDLLTDEERKTLNELIQSGGDN